MTLSNFSDIGNITGFLVSANDTTNGSFWLGILFMIFMVLVIIFIAYGIVASIITSSFISLVLGVLLAYTGLILWQYTLIFLAIIVIMMIYTAYLGNRQQ